MAAQANPPTPRCPRQMFSNRTINVLSTDPSTDRSTVLRSAGMSTEVDHAADPARADGEYAAGQVLDRRYRLGQRLGRGGFGDVWRAEELLPDGAPFREVALKLLVSTFDAANWAEEAKLLA